MKKLFLSCLFFLAVSALKAQTLTLKELNDFFEWKDTTKIDNILAQRAWVYMSSEVENGDQVDIWMYEKQQGHVVQGMFVLVSNANNASPAHNQAVLHLLSMQQFATLQSEASQSGYSFFKQDKSSATKQSDYWKSDKRLLVFTTDRESQLPYKVMIANISKR